MYWGLKGWKLAAAICFDVIVVVVVLIGTYFFLEA